MQPNRTSIAALALASILTAGALRAQEPVRTLRHVIGLESSTAEARLQTRGFELVRRAQAGDSAFAYFLEPRTGRCVTARSTNGHLASVVYSPDDDCRTEPPPLPPGPTSLEPGEEEFDTVCGVEADGRETRYRCHLRNRGCSPGPGKRCTTTVTMPGDEYRIAWGGKGTIDVTFEGRSPRTSTVTNESGQTRFAIDGTVYFVYRLKREADRELARLAPPR